MVFNHALQGRRFWLAARAMLTLAFLAPSACATEPLAAEDAARWVDPFIGTAWTGNTHPGASLPFGLVQPGPDSGTGNWKYCAGYKWNDPWIYGFSQTHLSGTGCPELADVRLLPFTGKMTLPPAKFRGYKDFSSEKAEPGYYAVTLTNFGVRAEMTCGRRMAFHRWTPAKGGRLEVLVDPQWASAHADKIPGHILSYNGAAHDDRRTVTGGYRHKAWLEREVHFKLRFDRPWAARRELPCGPGEKAPRTVYSFDVPPGGSLGARIAISTTDDDGAERNFAAEDRLDFDSARKAARCEWNELLSRAEIHGADRAQLTTFYTSLYHLFLQPNDIADADGRYRGADDRIHVGKGGRYFTGLSLWDTFRAAHPLYTILTPELVEPFVESMLEQYRAVGFLPVIPYFGCESYCMIGNHAVPVIVDAWLKGFRGFDGNLAYEAVTNSLTASHVTPHGTPKIKEDWNLLNRYGYYPYDIVKGESVSRTLECSYDDWCAAAFARARRDWPAERFFSHRAMAWTNVLDRSLGLVRGKDSQGRWRTPFDPFRFGGGGDWETYDCTEGNAWQWTWHVFQDPAGLVTALGGARAFAAKLDSVFRQREILSGAATADDTTGLIGQYVHGNEPSHHIAYFYQFAGRPDRTAAIVREVCDRFYLPKPDGLCGNDDCGQMSAWYVFACLGFYPFNPCGGDYVVGAPQAADVTLRLADGKAFRVVAKNLSKKNKYVRRITLNGKPLEGLSVRHADIAKGGELVFEMAAESRFQPNKYELPPASRAVAEEARAAKARIGAVAAGRILAHRGESEACPENTVPAFAAAVAGGFGFEFDVWLSNDGELFVTHDAWLGARRGHAARGWATNVMWRGALENSDVGVWKDPRWRGTRMPVIDDALAFAGDGHVAVIHVCDCRWEKVMPKVKEAIGRHANVKPENTYVQCDNGWLKKNMPGWRGVSCALPRKGWLVTDEPIDLDAAIRGIDPAVTPLWAPRWDEDLITAGRVAACHARGVKVGVWTVNDAASAWSAFGRGVDYVYTDRPFALMEEMKCFR